MIKKKEGERKSQHWITIEGINKDCPSSQKQLKLKRGTARKAEAPLKGEDPEQFVLPSIDAERQRNKGVLLVGDSKMKNSIITMCAMSWLKVMAMVHKESNN